MSNSLVGGYQWSLLHFHKQSAKPDIVIFTSGRSGGTWLMEIIAANKRIRSISEPLSLGLVTHPSKRVFGEIRPSTGYPFVEKPEHLRQYFTDILLGKVEPFTASRIWRKNRWRHHYITDRTVLKITHGKGLIEWFPLNFDVKILYFIRHPIPTALSMIERRFDTKTGGFMNDRAFVEQYLDEKLLKTIKSIRSNNSQLAQFVLSWCLENLIPARLAAEGKIDNLLSYEQLLQQPRHCCLWLADRLGLNEDQLLKHINVPSSTTDKGSDELQGNQSQKNNWRQEISAEEEHMCYDILDRFGIDFYKQGQILPAEQYLV